MVIETITHLCRHIISDTTIESETEKRDGLIILVHLNINLIDSKSFQQNKIQRTFYHGKQ